MRDLPMSVPGAHSLLRIAPPQDMVPWWLGQGVGGSGLWAAQAYATGDGVRIGMVEQGINLLHHSLIAARIEASGACDADLHGTQVAALIAGQMGASGGGGGAAAGATLVFAPLALGSGFAPDAVAQALALQVGVDVANNSWGAARAFDDNFRTSAWAGVGAAIAQAAEDGRGGLGTSLVFAAGNGRMIIGGENRGDDANFHNLTNARQVIAVAATGAEGDVAFFSSPGANILLAAPGQGLISAAEGSGGAPVSGTSFAAPLVTGTVALMLQVNPALGWRDVQDILAMTARVPAETAGAGNAGDGVNGGGLVFDRDVGFGLLDAEAAVRLARTWRVQSTSQNEAHVFQTHAGRTGADGRMAEFVFDVPPAEAAFRLDWVTLTLTLTDARLRDLRIVLISPAGTESVIAPNLAAAGTRTWLDFSFASAATRGEDIAGSWTLRLSHAEASTRFSVYAARLDFHGDRDTPDDVHVFTRSYAALAAQDAERQLIMDSDGGVDTLNFAAAAAGVSLDLGSGEAVLDGITLRLQGSFERVIGTVGADVIMAHPGMAATLFGLEGNDRLTGGDGHDRLDGGRGADLMTGGAGNDVFIFNNQGDRAVEGPGGGRDQIQSGVSLDLRLAGAGVEEVLLTGSGDLWVIGTTADNRLTGNAGTNHLRGNAGRDWLTGGAGADTLTGGAGADVFVLSAGGDAALADRITDFLPGLDGLAIDLADMAGGAGLALSSGPQTGPGPVLWQDVARGMLLYDPDGAGGLQAITLVLLPRGLRLFADDISIL